VKIVGKLVGVFNIIYQQKKRAW